VHPTVRSRCESRVEVSILIADDQAPARAGFKMILETSPELHVIAEAHDGASRRGGQADRPGIVLMDIRMSGIDGLEPTRRIRPPAIRRGY